MRARSAQSCDLQRVDLQRGRLGRRAWRLKREVGILKDLALLVCRLGLLLVLTGTIWSSPTPPETFRIVGHTTSFDWEPSSSGIVGFQLSTAGDVNGCLEGTFTFEEWGVVNLVPAARVSLGAGANVGIMTIMTDSGEVRIAFGGETNSLLVWGRFSVLEGTGDYSDLQGRGIYVGNGGFQFMVQFVGTFSELRSNSSSGRTLSTGAMVLADHHK
jgi:hypothetical protein